jgi:hypothetical protein
MTAHPLLFDDAETFPLFSGVPQTWQPATFEPTEAWRQEPLVDVRERMHGEDNTAYYRSTWKIVGPHGAIPMTYYSRESAESFARCAPWPTTVIEVAP